MNGYLIAALLVAYFTALVFCASHWSSAWWSHRGRHQVAWAIPTLALAVLGLGAMIEGAR